MLHTTSGSLTPAAAIQVERLASEISEILPKAADDQPATPSSAKEAVVGSAASTTPAPAHGGSLEPVGELAAMNARLEALEAAREKQEEELKALRLENERRQAEYEAWKTDKDKLKRWVRWQYQWSEIGR